jgi:hypothetical protein
MFRTQAHECIQDLFVLQIPNALLLWFSTYRQEVRDKRRYSHACRTSINILENVIVTKCWL